MTMQRYDEQIAFCKFFRKKNKKKCIFLLLLVSGVSFFFTTFVAENVYVRERSNYTKPQFHAFLWLDFYAIIDIIFNIILL